LTEKVFLMAGLLNKWTEYVIDGEPVALGVIPIGDAVLCTNPLYGRGCSIAYWSANLLTLAIAENPDDLREIALAFDAALQTEIHPWYRASVDQDREARRIAAAMLAGIDPDADKSDPRTITRAIIRDGLGAALRVDPVVLRKFFRSFNLLIPPDALQSDADFGARVLAVLADEDNRPQMPYLGPATRAEFLALLPTP
jgi:hypothetical protein